MSFSRGDLVAVVIAGAAALRMLLPFIVLGALLSAFPRPRRWPTTWSWSPTWIVATVAALGLGPLPGLAMAARGLMPGTPPCIPPDPESASGGLLTRALHRLDDLVGPYLVSALIGGGLLVLTPTDLLWTALGPSYPWRLIIVPVLVGLLRPRGGSELPLLAALLAKGLDPAGAVAVALGAAYWRAGSARRAALHLISAVAVGLAVQVLLTIGPFWR